MVRRARYSKGTVGLVIFAVIMTPLLIGLGLWQLSRAEEKQTLIKLQAESSQELIQLTTLANVDWNSQALSAETWNYKKVDVKGHYDKTTYVLLDNRTRNGKAGYEVINLFRTDNGQSLWVNRGWIQAPLYRDQWPAIKSVSGDVAVTGSIYLQPEQSFTLAEAEIVNHWPRRIQDLDINELNVEFEHDSYPFTLRLADDNQPGALETGWSIPKMSPEKHFGYAFQWFSLAVVLVVMTGIAIGKNNTTEVEQTYDT